MMWFVRTAIVGGAINSIVAICRFLIRFSATGNPFIVPALAVIAIFGLTCAAAIWPANIALQKWVTALLVITAALLMFVILGTWNLFAIIGLATCGLWFIYRSEMKVSRSIKQG